MACDLVPTGMGAIRCAAVALLLCAVARSQSCGSIDFSGSSGPLEVSQPMSFAGDFTIECWATTADVGVPFALVEPYGSYPSLFVQVFPPTSLCWNAGCPSVSIIAGQWYHYAVTRAGSDLSVFIDGALVDQTTDSNLIGTPTTVLHIGGVASGGEGWPGAIADFRVVTGAALYT